MSSILLAATNSMSLPPISGAQFLLIGGGGSGSGPVSPGRPGGGGAGGVVYASSWEFSRGDYTITVGTGGVARGYNYAGDKGLNTLAFGFTAEGGGGGKGGGSTGGVEVNGGSGGGNSGSSTQNTYSGTANVTGYGNNGGINTNAPNYIGGGGGGAGGNGGGSGSEGLGGAGLTNSFLNDIQYGENVGGNYYVAGGGGGGSYGGTQRSGGAGGGGAGAKGNSNPQINAVAGTDGYGGGGGGGNRSGFQPLIYLSSGAGGDGVVLVWLPGSHSANYTGTVTTSSKTVNGVSGTLLKFTSSGTWTL